MVVAISTATKMVVVFIAMDEVTQIALANLVYHFDGSVLPTDMLTSMDRVVVYLPVTTLALPGLRVHINLLA